MSPGGDGRAGTRVLALELRHDTAPDDVPAAVAATLRDTGLVRAGADVRVVHRHIGRGPTDPTRASVEAFAVARAVLGAAELDAEIVGGAAAFGADSFNEQVIQGLRAEEMTA